jgi:hypothetical protein
MRSRDRVNLGEQTMQITRNCALALVRDGKASILGAQLTDDVNVVRVLVRRVDVARVDHYVVDANARESNTLPVITI